MLRLRTSVSLSLLALAAAVAGTAWLTTLTSHWQGPAGTSSAANDKVRRVLRRHPRAPAPREPIAGHNDARTRLVAVPSRSTSDLPTLTPIDMPPLPASWLRRADFASGSVVLRLGVDGQGRVSQAEVANSSGNTALDERALRTVAHWRFAVPGDRPEGLTGTLVMRFEDAPRASSL